MIISCPYCGLSAKLVGGDAIYPHRQDLYEKKFYQCAPCDAFVGCHKGMDRPFGTMANAELREMRKRAHYYFDQLWNACDVGSRSAAYKWLSRKLEIERSKCHIGMMDLYTAKRAFFACKYRVEGMWE